MKKNIFLAVVGLLLLCSCDDFLDQDSPSTILATNYFTSESSLETYANGFLSSYTTSATTLTHGDQDAEYVARTNQSSFFTGSWSATEQDGWDTDDWSMLYNVNYFLAHFREADAEEEVFLHYEAVARFWRAFFYWSKLRTFGGVPWYDEPIDANDDETLYKGRDSREYLTHMMLEDLNFAAENCSVESEYVNCGVINGYIVNAFKARFCLYEGTYRKYHSVNPEDNEAWDTQYETYEDFLNAAIDAAEFIMDSGQYSLVSNSANVATQYRTLFNSEEIDYTEIIWAREYSSTLPLLHSTTWQYNSGTSGNCWSMNKSFLNTYLMLDGSRYTDQDDYISTSYVDEVAGRDYRLSQTIITPGYTKKQGGTSSEYTPNYNITRTGYQIIKWNIDDDSYESTTSSYNSLSIFRYAEVLLVYAEAKAELGTFTETDWNNTIALLRERAGVASDIPDSYDPYLYEYFDYQTTDKWILEIRRERGIEMYMENLRYDDLMRWCLGHLIERPWTGIYAPLGVKQTLDSAASKFICIVQSRAGTEIGTEYIILNNNESLYLDDNDCLVFEPIERVWTDNMYLRPIPQEAIDINPNLEQNYGW